MQGMLGTSYCCMSIALYLCTRAHEIIGVNCVGGKFSYHGQSPFSTYKDVLVSHRCLATSLSGGSPTCGFNWVSCSHSGDLQEHKVGVIKFTILMPLPLLFAVPPAACLLSLLLHWFMGLSHCLRVRGRMKRILGSI